MKKSLTRRLRELEAVALLAPACSVPESFSAVGAKADGFSFGPDLSYRVRVANDLESRRRAYHLVYDAYIEKGYAMQAPSRMWLTLHNALPSTVTILIERDGCDIAALTVVPDSALGLPADELYAEELQSLRTKGRRPAELVSFGGGADSEGSPVLAKLLNVVYVYAYRLLDVTDFVITIIPRHARIYHRRLRFGNLGCPRRHERINGTVGCLEHLRLSVLDELIRMEHPPEGVEPTPTRTLYRNFEAQEGERVLTGTIRRNLRPMTEEELRYFLVEQSNVWEQASVRERCCLQDSYPGYDLEALLSKAQALR